MFYINVTILWTLLLHSVMITVYARVFIILRYCGCEISVNRFVDSQHVSGVEVENKVEGNCDRELRAFGKKKN